MKPKIRILLLSLLTIAIGILNSCSLYPTYTTAYQVAMNSGESPPNPYENYQITIQTPKFYFSGYNEYLLRGYIRDGEVTSMQLYLKFKINKSFNSAKDINGRELDLIQINRWNLSDEHVAINLDESYIKEGLIEGYNIRLYGMEGSAIVIVQSFVVQGFVDKLNSVVEHYFGKSKPDKQEYLKLIDLYGFSAKYYTSYQGEQVPTVQFKLKNRGTLTLNKVKVTVYFRDSEGNVISDEDYYPVQVSSLSLEPYKPLKPNYIWQMERGTYYEAPLVPSEWQEGNAYAEITDIEFAEGY